VFAVSIAADGSQVLAGSNDHSAYLLDATGRVSWVHTARSLVRAAHLLSDGRALLATSPPHGAVVELAPTGRPLGEAWTTGRDMWGLDATPDGRTVALGGHPGVALLDWPARRVVWSALEPDRFWHVGVVAEPRRIVAASRNDYLVVLDGAGHELWRRRADADVVGAAVSADGSTIVGTDWAFTIHCLRADGQVLWTHRTNNRNPKGVALTSRGELIAVATESEQLSATSGTGWVMLFSRRGELLWTHEIAGSVQDVALSQDGRFLAAGTQLGEVWCFENAVTQQVVPGGPFAGAAARALVLPREKGGGT
jgi:outer membrane protein assembly factor BamB